MAITITTTQSSELSCPGGLTYNGEGDVTLTGYSGLVSIGVQTSGLQDQFAIVQNFVSADGTGGYVQVANTSDSATGWYYWTVQVSDTSDAEGAKVGEAKPSTSTFERKGAPD